MFELGLGDRKQVQQGGPAGASEGQGGGCERSTVSSLVDDTGTNWEM